MTPNESPSKARRCNTNHTRILTTLPRKYRHPIGFRTIILGLKKDDIGETLAVGFMNDLPLPQKNSVCSFSLVAWGFLVWGALTHKLTMYQAGGALLVVIILVVGAVRFFPVFFRTSPFGRAPGVVEKILNWDLGRFVQERIRRLKEKHDAVR